MYILSYTIRYNRVCFQFLLKVAEWKVLLIEAGIEENYVMDVPILANFLQFTDANWKYKTVPSNQYCLGVTKILSFRYYLYK